jgi:hypothetical protein
MLKRSFSDLLSGVLCGAVMLIPALVAILLNSGAL